MVLSVAHWLEELEPQDVRVVCGDWDIKSSAEPKPYQERKVASISIHPLYNPSNFWNDIGLLHLETEFDLLEPHINVVCLPTDENFEDFDKAQCQSAGWGKSEQGKKFSLCI